MKKKRRINVDQLGFIEVFNLYFTSGFLVCHQCKVPVFSSQTPFYTACHCETSWYINKIARVKICLLFFHSEKWLNDFLENGFLFSTILEEQRLINILETFLFLWNSIPKELSSICEHKTCVFWEQVSRRIKKKALYTPTGDKSSYCLQIQFLENSTGLVLPEKIFLHSVYSAFGDYQAVSFLILLYQCQQSANCCDCVI